MSLSDIPNALLTPACVFDIKALRRNTSVLDRIKADATCRILLDTKTLSSYQLFPFLKEGLDGTIAGGLYEARLGYEKFGKELHVASPAYTDDEMEDLLPIVDHVCFNSLSQVNRFLPMCRAHGKKVGVRLNPNYSQATDPRLDPCAPQSRFGVRPIDLEELPWKQIDFIYIQALPNNFGDKSINLIHFVDQNFSDCLRKVEEVNFGGGHSMTHPQFEIAPFTAALDTFRRKYSMKLVLEEGGSVALNAGSLVATVLDVMTNSAGRPVAILNATALCRGTEDMETPYRPEVRFSGRPNEKAYTFTLGGNTCESHDIFGEYSFDQPLQPGSRVIIDNAVQYNSAKRTTFNGLPLPDLAVLHEDGRYEVLSRFGYNDFVGRLGPQPTQPTYSMDGVRGRRFGT